MGGYKWTIQEKEIVRQHYPNKGVAATYQALNQKRTKGAIVQMANKLGLVVEGVKWTDEEAEIVKKYYGNGGTKRVKAELTKLGYHRTKEAIVLKGKALGIKGKHLGKFQEGCQVKTCPNCQQEKELSEFDKYYSKAREAYRYQSYCKTCLKVLANERSKKYYQKNKEKIKGRSFYFQCKHRAELADCYVVASITKHSPLTAADVRANPELIELKRKSLQLKRQIKKCGTPEV